MLKNCCDLHTHSVYSDGTYTPTELIAAAEKLNLSAIALTDHNTTHGLKEFSKAAEGKQVEAVLGVELSTDYGKIELHIVGLFLKEQDFPKIETLIAEMEKRKIESNIRLAENLKKEGYDVDYEELKSRTPRGHINRAHFAAELVKKGYASSVQEAFNTLLAKDGGFYEEPQRLPVYETIAFLKEIGATAILAHPFLNLTEEELRVFLQEAKKYGLDGMETEYSTYDEETTAKAKEIAKEFGLKESGGSDFHGGNKPHIALGIGQGNLAVPKEFLEKMR